MTRLGFLIETVSRQEWEEVLGLCQCATFFHSPSWIDAMCDAFPGHSNATCIARAPDGRRTILPLVRSWEGNRSGLSGLESVPPFCYGGPIFDGPPDSDLIAAATLSIIESSIVRAHAVVLHGNPYLAIKLQGFRVVEKPETHIISLSGGYEHVRAHYKSGHKSTLTKSKLSSVAIRLGESMNDWQGYFELYQKSLQRWGDSATSNHPWNMFARLRNVGPKVRLWLAESGGVVCSGAIVVYQFPRAFYWHAAFDSNYSKLSANNILQDAIIRDACSTGYESYDLLSSGPHQGVASFKDSLGAKRVPIVGYEWDASWFTRLAGAAHKFLGTHHARKRSVSNRQET